MSKFVVLEHHHDAIASVYRLVFAKEIEETFEVQVPNPSFDANEEQDEENQPTMLEATTVTFYSDVQEIVWADDDPKWEDKGTDEIVAEQTQIVKDLLTKIAAEQEQDEMRRIGAITDLGGAGAEL